MADIMATIKRTLPILRKGDQYLVQMSSSIENTGLFLFKIQDSRFKNLES